MAKYLPAIFAFLLGLLVIKIPLLAVFMVAVPLFGFAFSYTSLIYRLARMPKDTAVVEIGGEPGFTTVSGYMFRRGNTVARFFRH